MKSLLLVYTILVANFSFNTSFARNLLPHKSNITHFVKGKIIDSLTLQPLEYVTILHLTTKGQLINKVTSGTNGSFALEIILSQNTQLTFTYLGYRPKTILVPAASTSVLDLGTIHLAVIPTQLKEVQILAAKALIERDLDKLIYNVEADPERSTLSALDMLRKVPLLTLDADDALQLNGTSNYRILINGQPSALFAQSPSDAFRSMPADMIKQIEVITNPPARYDAQGTGGIINIITYKKNLSGYNGSVTLGASNPNGWNLSAATSAKVGKFNLAGNLGLTTQNSPTAQHSSLREDRLQLNSLTQTGTSNNHSDGQHMGGEIGYELGTQTQLSISYGRSRSRNENSSAQEAALRNSQDELTQAYRNLNNGTNGWLGYDAGLNYQHSFKNNEVRQLSMAYKLSANTGSGSTDFALQSLLNYKDQVSSTSNQEHTREQSLQADYVQPLGKQTLELGLKTALQGNSSDYLYKMLDVQTNTFALDPALSNRYSYEQRIHAAYTSLSLRKNNWGLKAGARLELTNIDARFESVQTAAQQAYSNLIPSISVSRRLGGSGMCNLSYTQRLERPGLYYLNPYVDITDPRNISYGNPGLVPTTSHVLNLGFNTFLKSTSFNADLFHQFTNNSIQQLTTLGTDSVARTTFANVGQNRTYGLTLSSNTTLFKKLNLSLSGGTAYTELTSIVAGRPQNNKGITYNASGNTSYRFGKDWRASGNISYTSSRIVLQGKTSGYSWSSLAVNKEFLKNKKARASFSVSSPFQKYRQTSREIIGPTFRQQQESSVIIRRYTLALTYRFIKI
ncbi:outer membrane beta-barrel family protein [Hymenobacter seoulensis]